MKIKSGDVIELELERRAIYSRAQPEAGRVTKRVFKVGEEDPYGWILTPFKKQKFLRVWRLSKNLQSLDSYSKPPLKYDIIDLKVLKGLQIMDKSTVRDLVGQLTEGWKKSEKGYTAVFDGSPATLAKGKDGKWYLHFKGRIIKMPKRGSFDHAEGVIKSMI